MLPPIPLEKDAEPERALVEADFLSEAQVWPLRVQMDPRAWLQNFAPEERPYGLDLLRSFTYFSPRLSEELFRSAVQRLGQHVLDFDRPRHAVLSSWRSFVEGLIVVPVRGERPNPSDSGFTYIRNMRNAFGLGESQFFEERDALDLLQRVHRAGVRRDVVFVDDFVGSGSQFVTTWKREVEVGGGALSFARVAGVTASRFFYCPLVSTTEGAGVIRSHCPEVTLSPAHYLGPEYSAFHPESRLWSPERRPDAVGVLKGIAARVGMPDTGGHDVDDWRGFAKLGLAIGFRDSIPDANLGVFRWEGPSWRPLFTLAT